MTSNMTAQSTGRDCSKLTPLMSEKLLPSGMAACVFAHIGQRSGSLSIAHRKHRMGHRDAATAG